jgi:hypothetical protein
VGSATTAAGAASHASTWPFASSALIGEVRLDGFVPRRMNESSAIHANPTASAPDNEASNQIRERS